MRYPGLVLILLFLALLTVPLAMWGIPQYRLYSERLAGEARLAEAQSSRRIAILEAEARRESAVALAKAEVLRELTRYCKIPSAVRKAICDICKSKRLKRRTPH